MCVCVYVCVCVCVCVQLILPYEGCQFSPLARGSMDGFFLQLDYLQDTSMDIHTRLGNLVATCEVRGSRVQRTPLDCQD